MGRDLGLEGEVKKDDIDCCWPGFFFFLSFDTTLGGVDGLCRFGAISIKALQSKVKMDFKLLEMDVI